MSVGSPTVDLGGAPATFRFAARVMMQNWCIGILTLVLPDGREIRLEGDTPGA